MVKSVSLANPSAHLSWGELACKDGTPYPNEYILDGRIYKLAHTFENIRRLCGNRSLVIHSAYRTPEWNKHVRGAPSSQHIQGRALDISSRSISSYFLYNIIQRNADALGVRGIGLYPTFIHVDIRESKSLVIWSPNVHTDKTSRG